MKKSVFVVVTKVTLPLLSMALQIQNSLSLTGCHLLQMIICDVMCVNTEIFVLS